MVFKEMSLILKGRKTVRSCLTTNTQMHTYTCTQTCTQIFEKILKSSYSRFNSPLCLTLHFFHEKFYTAQAYKDLSTSWSFFVLRDSILLLTCIVYFASLYKSHIPTRL